ncbi:thiamine pyrophosphokinase [Vermiconidia calcicola]|uniref:Thiamine pyrophosphokinase n=1 Tax=Vermiconidia calcicola TaxID=1690605 RepID=A0ACC3N3J0_9PEZI|nr:thiamine pyrophosphokinase [Vermiconidia calcicola]
MSYIKHLGHVNAELRPTKYLEECSNSGALSNGSGEGSIALIVLNSPVTDHDYFRRLHEHACFRVYADGAANRIYELLTTHHAGLEWTEALRSAPPDVIHGDLDSLDSTVRQRYEEIGIEISEDPDQYSTDFGKAVKKVIQRLPRVQDVLVLGSIGGRVDQGIGLLGELYREQKLRLPAVRLWLFSEASVSTIVQPGLTTIHTPLKKGLITPNVGILPLYGPAVICTEGLEWDVKDWPTEMGGQMSTSNHIVENTTNIQTNNDVLFTVERAVNS